MSTHMDQHTFLHNRRVQNSSDGSHSECSPAAATTQGQYPSRSTNTLGSNPSTYASIYGDGVQIVQLANTDAELLMMPRDYHEDRNDVGEEAWWREDYDDNAGRCWKTNLVYQHIGEHPNMVRQER
jgi:hypothetical protein